MPPVFDNSISADRRPTSKSSIRRVTISADRGLVQIADPSSTRTLLSVFVSASSTAGSATFTADEGEEGFLVVFSDRGKDFGPWPGALFAKASDAGGPTDETIIEIVEIDNWERRE